MIKIEHFQLEDAEGNFHSYAVTPFGGSAGLKLAARIGGLICEPIAAAVAAYAKDADLSGVGASLRTAITAFDDKLVRDLLANTHRDGSLLAKEAAFDAAFGGNWLELYELLYKVIEVNKFIPFTSILKRFGVDVGDLMGRLQQPLNPASAGESGSN
jgi:hypothetical protein